MTQYLWIWASVWVCYLFETCKHKLTTESSFHTLMIVTNVCVAIRVFPQANVHLNVRGQTAGRSSPAPMSWRVTTARTRARSASTAPCVTSASWGATTWPNTPAVTQASIPACSRAPAWPRGAAAPCPCLPLTPEAGVLSACETHTHVLCTHKQMMEVDGVDPVECVGTPTSGVCFYKKKKK